MIVLAVEKNVNPKWLLAMEKLATKNLTMKNVVVESCGDQTCGDWTLATKKWWPKAVVIKTCGNPKMATKNVATKSWRLKTWRLKVGHWKLWQSKCVTIQICGHQILVAIENMWWPNSYEKMCGDWNFGHQIFASLSSKNNYFLIMTMNNCIYTRSQHTNKLFLSSPTYFIFNLLIQVH